MRVTNIIYEDCTNYKEICMFIGTISCGGKCCIEQNIPLSICLNNSLRNASITDISDEIIINRYLSNPITSGVVFGGMESFEQWEELKHFITLFRQKSQDMLIIYTGYYEEEIKEQIEWLKQYPNIIIKFGRYLINSTPHFDKVLGVTLASSNQYAKQIS
jgi:pyruvate-formate lyase-activating enzyme